MLQCPQCKGGDLWGEFESTGQVDVESEPPRILPVPPQPKGYPLSGDKLAGCKDCNWCDEARELLGWRREWDE